MNFRNLRHISIRWKLTALIVTISSVSLLLASLAFITSDRINTRQTVTNNLASMAEIIADYIHGGLKGVLSILNWLAALSIIAGVLWALYNISFAG